MSGDQKMGEEGLSLTLRSSRLSFQQQTLNPNSVELEELGNWGTDGEIWLSLRQWDSVPHGQCTTCFMLGPRALDQTPDIIFSLEELASFRQRISLKRALIPRPICATAEVAECHQPI